jgi:hypothetical protein
MRTDIRLSRDHASPPPTRGRRSGCPRTGGHTLSRGHSRPANRGEGGESGSRGGCSRRTRGERTGPPQLGCLSFLVLPAQDPNRASAPRRTIYVRRSFPSRSRSAVDRDPNALLPRCHAPPSALGPACSSRKSSIATSGSWETCEKKAATLRPVACSTISVKRGRIQSWNIVRVSRT